MSLLTAALELVDQLGAPIFPVNPATNGPLIASAHPEGDPMHGRCRGDCGRLGHGFYDATTDRQVIEQWWTDHPNASIGLRTGITCDVLDIDHQDFVEGVADLPDCETAGGPTALSGGGKFHLYFKRSGFGRLIRFAEHCDWLGTDGYVVAPPSGHPSGGRYRWETPPSTAELTDAPVELQLRLLIASMKRRPAPMPAASPRTLQRTLPGGAGRWNPAGVIARMTVAAVGERNHTLNWCAHRLGLDVHEGKATRAEADVAADELHVAAIAAGLTEREVEASIRSGYEAGLGGQPSRRPADR